MDGRRTGVRRPATTYVRLALRSSPASYPVRTGNRPCGEAASSSSAEGQEQKASYLHSSIRLRTVVLQCRNNVDFLNYVINTSIIRTTVMLVHKMIGNLNVQRAVAFSDMTSVPSFVKTP